MLSGLLVTTAACTNDAAESSPSASADVATPVTNDDAAQADRSTPKSIEPPEPPPTGHAVAKVGALLFTSSTGEVGFELPPLAGEVPGMTINVVGEQDGRLVVETLAAEPPEHHCAATLDGLGDFRLRLYLASSDLLPVTTHDFEHEFGDGTKIRLTRGVPVPQGAAELVVRGTSLKVEVPTEELGRYYEPGEPLPATDPKGSIRSLAGHSLTYGGQALAEDELFSESGELNHYGVVAKGSDTLVTVRNPCAEIVALVSTERMSAPPPLAKHFSPEAAAEAAGILGRMDDESGHFLASPYGAAFAVGNDDEDVWGGLTGTEVGGFAGIVGAGTTYEVKAGAAILWSDGSSAGQVLSNHSFSVAPRDLEGRSCFDVALSKDQPSAVTLCFARTDVSEVASPTAMGLGTLGGLGTIGSETGGGYGLLGAEAAGSRSSGGGGLGTTGGGGTGFGHRGKKVPRVRQAKAKVKGALDKDIIRRIVRAHINEVRYCYNKGLVVDPSLEGRVAIQFTVGPTGKVPTAVVASTTLSDKKVGECIAKSVKRWKFPRPSGGGVVVVTYPFVLSPG